MKLLPQAGPNTTSWLLNPGFCLVVLAVAMGYHRGGETTRRARPSRGGHYVS